MGSSGEGRGAERCYGVGDDAIIPPCWECDDIMRWGHNHNVIGAGTARGVPACSIALLHTGARTACSAPDLGDNAIAQRGRWTHGHHLQGRAMKRDAGRAIASSDYEAAYSSADLLHASSKGAMAMGIAHWQRAVEVTKLQRRTQPDGLGKMRAHP